MGITTGYEWDVWPRDTSGPRVACGMTGSAATAIQAVEAILARCENALIGTIDQPFSRQWLCRRGGPPGTYVWLQRSPRPPASAGN